METIAASDQRHLRSVAYKLLGSMADAEDMIQETYLRWYRLTPVERAGIDEPLAWQTRVLSRLCIDTLRSARHRKETYVGEWLPEPVPSSASTFRTSVEEEDPLDRISVDDSVSMALMIVLDSMTPAQRVAFVLHDIFQYPFPEVAQVVGRSPESCRSLASAARKRIRNATAGQTSREEHRRINRAFKTAWTTGRIDELISLLDPRATAVTDGVDRSVLPWSLSTEQLLSPSSSQTSSGVNPTWKSKKPLSTGNLDCWALSMAPRLLCSQPGPYHPASPTFGSFETRRNSMHGTRFTDGSN